MRMSSLASAAWADVESRVARLACMPDDVDAAVARFVGQVRDAWTLLARRGRAPLVAGAMRAAPPVVPCLAQPHHARLGDLVGDLERALASHHPEELRVASFAWLSCLAESLSRDGDGARLEELLQGLERAPGR